MPILCCISQMKPELYAHKHTYTLDVKLSEKRVWSEEGRTRRGGMRCQGTCHTWTKYGLGPFTMSQSECALIIFKRTNKIGDEEKKRKHPHWVVLMEGVPSGTDLTSPAFYGNYVMSHTLLSWPTWGCRAHIVEADFLLNLPLQDENC